MHALPRSSTTRSPPRSSEALQTAADLGAHARRLTPDNDAAEARRRAVDEAECRHLLGQPARARDPGRGARPLRAGGGAGAPAL